MDNDIENMMRLWGKAYNDIAQDTPNLPQKSLFQSLADEFSKEDVMTQCMRLGIKTPVRNITSQWQSSATFRLFPRVTIRRRKMKKEHLQKLRNVAAKVNPFLLVDKQTKTPLVYANDEDAYYDVFVKLLFAFPRGYMDLTLFMVEYMDIPLSDAELYCGRNQVFYFPFTTWIITNAKIGYVHFSLLF